MKDISFVEAMLELLRYLTLKPTPNRFTNAASHGRQS